ncbi:DNA/RNA non-specific endonuclease [Actinomyces ruminicola]|uniref:DNA/RNA non-specific endonuclease n=1 Tax=Actinomyces ruminicola TaxID=332524 RepID=UPI00164F20B4|nr:DNA/RNA non-specific endonuclease [Actinomyces ruminicola]
MLVGVRLVVGSVSRSAATEPVLLCVVVGEPGGGVAMCPDLRDPLPCATYTVDGKFHYTTDEWGRTVRLQVDRLDVVDPDATYESKAVQRRIGHYGDGLGGGFQGGHLGGKRFGGPPEDINVVPMRESVNGNHPGSFYELEQKIADNPGDYRSLDIRIEYDGPPTNADSVTSLGDVNPDDRVPTQWTVASQDANGLARTPQALENR